MPYLLLFVLLGFPMLAFAQKQPPRPSENTRLAVISREYSDAQLAELKAALLQENVDVQVVVVRDSTGSIASMEGSATLQNGAKATFSSKAFLKLVLTLYASYGSTIPYRIEVGLEGNGNSSNVDN